MSNVELQELYEKVYADGKEDFFTFGTGDITGEVISELDWMNLKVLEIGCGTGETASAIAMSGARYVLAMDYAKSAISQAQKKHRHDRLEFRVGSFEDLEEIYDVILLQEVIEHTDDPFAILSRLSKHTESGGHLLVTCPSFLNVRGIVWMTLQTLLKVPMSLSDKQFISPFEMEKWAKQLSLKLTWRTFRHSQGQGSQMVVDMKKRLTNALQDVDLDNSHVDELLTWLTQLCQYEKEEIHNGAKGFYHFIKP